LDFTTSKAGKAVQIQSIAYDSDTETLFVYVQNVGDGAIEFIASECYYANGFLQTGATVDPIVLTEEETATATTTYPMLVGQDVLVRITTVDGTFNEAGFTYEGEGGVVGPPPTVTSVRVEDDSATIGGSVSFTDPTEDGNLLVLIAGHRAGDPDTYHSPILAGWTLRGVEYNNPSTGTDRRIVAIFTKTSVAGETLNLNINWNDPGATGYLYWATLREFTGATTYSYVNNDGSNTGPAVTSATLPLGPVSAGGNDNVLAIVGMVFRDDPPGAVGTVSFSNDFSGVSLHTNTLVHDGSWSCPGVTAFVTTNDGDKDWQTTASWTGPRMANGLLALFTFS